jgi:predicted transcriptional regulator
MALSGANKSETSIDIRRLQAIELRREGYGIGEIAEKLGIARNTVSRYLNSRETKEIVEEARNRLKGLVNSSVDVYALAIQRAEGDMANAQRAARDILKNYGLLIEQLQHTGALQFNLQYKVDDDNANTDRVQSESDTISDGSDPASSSEA